jgi:hypothetical protein
VEATGSRCSPTPYFTIITPFNEIAPVKLGVRLDRPREGEPKDYGTV